MAKLDQCNLDETNFNYNSLDDAVPQIPHCNLIGEALLNKSEKTRSSILPPKTPPRDQSNLKILVVDDTCYNLYVMKELLA